MTAFDPRSIEMGLRSLWNRLYERAARTRVPHAGLNVPVRMSGPKLARDTGSPGPVWPPLFSDVFLIIRFCDECVIYYYSRTIGAVAAESVILDLVRRVNPISIGA